MRKNSLDPTIIGILIGFFLLLFLIVWIASKLRKANLYDAVRRQLDKRLKDDAVFLQKQAAFKKGQIEFRQEKLNWKRTVLEDTENIERLAKEKSLGFPWLAQAYSDYFYLKDLKISDHLKFKPHPALKAAQQVREVAAERRKAEKLCRILKYQLEYYETLFPWLTDFREEGLDELVQQMVDGVILGKGEPHENDEVDPAKKWLTKAEYENLPTTEKYQLALDRYFKKKKTKWELGRDYERYVGYIYETKGFKVSYQGIVEGLQDLGRDLITVGQDGKIQIIQCKYWSTERLIHEKHICQLYGTLTAYRVDNPNQYAIAVLITSTFLSERAKQFADALGIKYRENRPLEAYPCIKCNVSPRGWIYHLPFDQQYDRTIISERLERFASTVAEAESLGFRRAFRWKGNQDS